MKSGYITREIEITPAYMRTHIFGGLTFYYDGKPEFFTFKAVIAESVGISNNNKLYTCMKPDIDKTEIEIANRPELSLRFGNEYMDYIKTIIRVMFSGVEVIKTGSEVNGTFDVETFEFTVKPNRFDNKQISLTIIGGACVELSILHDLTSKESLFTNKENKHDTVYVSDEEFQPELEQIS